MIRYNTKRYWGKSTDVKPINAQIGDRFLQIDTSDEYVFNSYNEWTLITGETYFLRNQTHANQTDIVKVHESIFNPDNLEILSSSIFIIEPTAAYYFLGDLDNSGVIDVNGTLKIGGALTNSGSIIGSGIIE